MNMSNDAQHGSHPETDGSSRAQMLRQELHAHGLRYSRARAAILEVFRRPNCGHLTAESLHGLLRDAGEDISLSTVYLNLAVLRDAGLLRELKGASGQSVFDANAQPHYHLVCTDTGEIHDLPAIEIDGVPLGNYLREEIRRRTGWDIEEPAILLRGRRPGKKEDARSQD